MRGSGGGGRREAEQQRKGELTYVGKRWREGRRKEK